MANVLLGCPLYDDRLGSGPSKAFWREASQKHQIAETLPTGSVIDSNCTKIWCDALNNRDQVLYMAILHSDVTPEAWWVDKLIEQAELHGADFVSALVPVKNLRGVYSTAISMPDGKHHFRRLTRKQAQHPDFPTTFGVEEATDALERLPEPLRVSNVPRGGFLFANTACMVCRVDRPWAEKVLFCNEVTLERRNDGFMYPYNISEDWYFTRAVAQHGGRVMATRAVAVGHAGSMEYTSDGDWGQDQDDESVQWWQAKEEALQH
jgi:hypothetical protein